jgi:hypothetical protein
MESRIDGYQQKVNLSFLLIQRHLKTGDRDALVNLMADFFDALTGGSFGAESRESDVHRAKLTYANGTNLVAHLRKTKPRLAWLSIVLAIIVLFGVLFLLMHSPARNLPPGWTQV